MHAKYTGFNVDHSEVIKAIKIDLTRHLNSYLNDFQDEFRYGIDKELGPCEYWTSVTLYDKLARIVSLMSSRVFVGLPLSREQEWMDASVNYTRDLVMAREAVENQPAILRPFLARFLPEVKSIKRYAKRGAVLLAPLIQEVLAREASGKSYQQNREENSRGTMISWILKYTTDRSVQSVTDDQMILTFAAISTTTGTATQAIFDLISRPEYIKPLRDEIQQVIEEDGLDNIGSKSHKLKKQSIPRLKKLDSFLKESQRLSPLSIVGMDRITTTTLNLSTGHTIPKGVHITFPSYAISMSAQSIVSSSDNAESYVPPHEFDGFRFSKLRVMEGNESKVCVDASLLPQLAADKRQHQFVATSSDSIHFGHGLHACPGRFFASNEIKVVLIELLQNWDMRFKGDVQRLGGVDKRPENKYFGMSILPNESAQIEFRRRRA